VPLECSIKLLNIFQIEGHLDETGTHRPPRGEGEPEE
jgi:hypothetical protein